MIAVVLAAGLPKLHWIIIFDLCLFGSLGLGALLNAPPVSDYGTDKFRYLMTLTLLSASASCLIRYERGLVRLARAWLIAAVCLAFVTVANKGLAERATPFGNNPIWAGRVFAAGIVMIVWLSMSRGVRLRWAVPSAALMLAGLAAAGSRGPLIASAVGVAILLVLGGHGRRRLIVAGGTAIAAIIATQLPLFQQSRIALIAPEGILTDYARYKLVSTTIGIVQDHPLGVGIGNWPNYSGLQGVYRYPHNLFLEVAAEFGIVLGLLLLAFVVLLFVKALLRSRGSHSMLLLSAWLAVEIVHVSVSGDLNARTFFFVLALTFLTLVRQQGGRRHSEGLNYSGSELNEWHQAAEQSREVRELTNY